MMLSPLLKTACFTCNGWVHCRSFPYRQFRIFPDRHMQETEISLPYPAVMGGDALRYRIAWLSARHCPASVPTGLFRSKARSCKWREYLATTVIHAAVSPTSTSLPSGPFSAWQPILPGFAPPSTDTAIMRWPMAAPTGRPYPRSPSLTHRQVRRWVPYYALQSGISWEVNDVASPEPQTIGSPV